MQILKTMDNVLSPSRKIGLSVDRDQADSTSLMTLASPTGHSLRPDGVMRALDGFRMLAKVRADSLPVKLSLALSPSLVCLHL